MSDYFLIENSICLRAIHWNDRRFFLKWHNDPEIRKNIGGLIPFSEAEFKEACEMKERVNPPNIWFSICADGNVVGIAGIHQIKYIQRNAEVSILIGENIYRNKGFASDALKVLEKYSFYTLQMHRLYANVFSGNSPIIEVLAKCGWEREGLLRDAAFWNGKFRNVYIYSKINGSPVSDSESSECPVGIIVDLSTSSTS